MTTSHQVLEMLCARVEQFITQRGRAIASLTSHQRRNKSNLLHSLLADPSVSDAVVSNGIPLIFTVLSQRVTALACRHPSRRYSPHVRRH